MEVHHLQNVPAQVSQCLQSRLPHRAFIHTHSKTNSSTYNWIFSMHPIILHKYSFLCLQSSLKKRTSIVSTNNFLGIYIYIYIYISNCNTLNGQYNTCMICYRLYTFMCQICCYLFCSFSGATINYSTTFVSL
jgi:hypothetical protein